MRAQISAKSVRLRAEKSSRGIAFRTALQRGTTAALDIVKKSTQFRFRAYRSISSFGDIAFAFLHCGPQPRKLLFADGLIHRQRFQQIRAMLHREFARAALISAMVGIRER